MGTVTLPTLSPWESAGHTLLLVFQAVPSRSGRGTSSGEELANKPYSPVVTTARGPGIQELVERVELCPLKKCV